MATGRVELLQVACRVAGAGGGVSERQAEKLRELADEAGVSGRSLDAMIEMAESNPAFFDNQAVMLQSDPDHTIRKLCEVACAGGDVSDDERKLLHDFAERLGVPHERCDEMLRAS